ncbi:hypothetical protein IEQ34_018202 [Dendrobium chrysotoxum]|uniref:Uncharacterized protein n=1 Tax=Dendrobium chrysotoxum TaxID=161865 RepID=A0AAV7GDV1_DENCH|nr:hypothetical protein IEQ34_018202 [Dendrobium chrysotoxum]
MSRYIEEEFLFKVGLSFPTGRSDARTLKPTSKVPEPPAPTSKVAPKRATRGEDPQVLKKKSLEGTATNTDKALPDSSSAKLHIPEEVLNHQCIGRHKAGDLIKFLQEEFKQKYDHKTKEAKVLKEELSECRTELANTMQSISLQNRQADQHQMEAGQMVDVTWRSSRRLSSLGGREEDRRHSKVRCKTDIIGGRAEDRRHSKVGQKTSITWRSDRRLTSLGGDGLAELRASDGGLAELRALGDDSGKVRASSGGSVKVRSSGSGPARVRAYGGGLAKTAPAEGKSYMDNLQAQRIQERENPSVGLGEKARALAPLLLLDHRRTTALTPLLLQTIVGPPPEVLHFTGPPPEALHFTGPPPEALHFAGPSPEALLFAGPPPEALHFAGPSPEALLFAGPPPEALHFAGPPPEALHFAGPPPEAVHFARPPLEVLLFAGPPPEALHFAGPPPEALHFAGPPPEALHFTGPPPEALLLTGPPPEALHYAEPPPEALLSPDHRLTPEFRRTTI